MASIIRSIPLRHLPGTRSAPLLDHFLFAFSPLGWKQKIELPFAVHMEPFLPLAMELYDMHAQHFGR